MAKKIKLPAEIVAAICHHLLRVAEEGDDGASGFSPAQMARLRSLPILELGKLGDFPVFSVVGDGDALEKALKILELRHGQEEIMAEFLRRGATAPLMAQLFRIERNHVGQMRAKLGIQPGKGRVRLPSTEIQEQIWLAWRARQEMAPRQRWLALADEFPALTLGELHAVVMSAV